MTRSRKRKLQRLKGKRTWMPLASAILAGSTAVHAEVTDTGELAEVVVTAQKRSEDLQKVPISMQVLGGEKLDQLQVSSFDDYAKFLPSVTFQTLGPGQAQLYFRGIASGGDGLHAGSASATGMYLDETPVTTISNSLDLHVYDIQRVEALAGPQGTLYGASSLSGTLRIITNKPDTSGFSGAYDVKADKYSAGNGGGQFEGYVNIPLSDNAAIRLVGYYEHQGGYIDNAPATRTYQRPSTGGAYPCPDGTVAVACPLTITNDALAHKNFNPVDTYGGRAALKVDLNDRWTVTPMVVYQHQKTSGNFTYDPQIGNLQVTDFTPDNSLDHWYQTALTVEGKISNFDVVYSGGYFERDTSITSDYSEYSVAYDYYGYSRFRNNAGQLIDPTQIQVQIDHYTKMTHELRVSTPATDVVHFTAGLFYQRQTDKIRDEYLIEGLGNNAQYAFSVPGQAPNLYLTQQDRTDADYAAFTDVTWNISDQWKLAGGIRGFVARNTLYGFFGFNNLYVDENNGDNFSHGSGTSGCNPPLADPNLVLPNTPGSNLPCVNTDKGIRESGETHRINLTYQIDPDHMVYWTYSTGFRPGGNNRRFGLQPYSSDTLTNFEGGWKTAWLDHTMRFNGAVFYEKWKGVQLGVTGPNGITDIWNIGNAAVKGIESDLNWLLWDHLDLSVSGTYVNAKTTTDFCGENATHTGILSSCPGAVDAASGTRLPVTPEVKANAIARYKFTVGDYKLFAQAAAVHQGSSNPYLESKPEAIVGPLPSFTTLDLSVGAARDRWTVELYLDNATDKIGELNRTAECGASYCYQNYRVYPVKPQIFGVKFGNKF
jgi:outer membrane receptor protein involved in Fe transport